MGRHADRLAKQHVHWGRARLAVRGPEVRPCEHCGMCLHGCPYGLIYSAEQTLRERLVPSTLFTYVPGYVVRRLTERPGAVTIDAVARASLEPRRFEAARVYLAAGVLASTAIVLESLKAFARPVVLRQSDHFMLPMLLRTSAGRASTERLHTLSQLFIELLDPSISRRGVHLQVYTYNDLYARLLKDRLGPASALVAPFLEPFIDRLVVVKGYLHSDESAGIRAQLQPGASGATLSLDAVPSPQSKAIVRSVTSWLRKNSRAIGAWPLPLGRHIGLPGSGVHVGGSFPMRHQPSALECDLLGRPQGWSRVHVVDASVFPTMPAASPTLTIMANAYRIARLSQHVQEATCSG
jgi:choline dehydrogenase-like flavoprotein